MKSKGSFSVQGSTTDAQDKVAAYYKEQATKHGWTEESVMNQPQMTMMNYSKEKRTLSLTIAGQDSETSVSIVIGGE